MRIYFVQRAHSQKVSRHFVTNIKSVFKAPHIVAFNRRSVVFIGSLFVVITSGSKELKNSF